MQDFLERCNTVPIEAFKQAIDELCDPDNILNRDAVFYTKGENLSTNMEYPLILSHQSRMNFGALVDQFKFDIITHSATDTLNSRVIDECADAMTAIDRYVNAPFFEGTSQFFSVCVTISDSMCDFIDGDDLYDAVLNYAASFDKTRSQYSITALDMFEIMAFAQGKKRPQNYEEPQKDKKEYPKALIDFKSHTFAKPKKKVDLFNPNPN